MAAPAQGTLCTPAGPLTACSWSSSGVLRTEWSTTYWWISGPHEALYFPERGAFLPGQRSRQRCLGLRGCNPCLHWRQEGLQEYYSENFPSGTPCCLGWRTIQSANLTALSQLDVVKSWGLKWSGTACAHMPHTAATTCERLEAPLHGGRPEQQSQSHASRKQGPGVAGCVLKHIAGPRLADDPVRGTGTASPRCPVAFRSTPFCARILPLYESADKRHCHNATHARASAQARMLRLP